MKTISFNYNAELRARFIRFKAFQFGIIIEDGLLSLALNYAERLDEKIESKYNVFKYVNRERLELI